MTVGLILQILGAFIGICLLFALVSLISTGSVVNDDSYSGGHDF